MAAASPAPWESVPPSEQLFVLITGANSGIGFGICQRLIDEYLHTRSLTSHLILLPTTRSAEKSLQTIRSLREHALHAATTSKKLPGRVGAAYKPEDAVRRIHVLSPVVDLCDLRAVHKLARDLCHGTVSNPPGLEGEYLTGVRIPRIDSLVCNAAFGGWEGFSYLGAIKMLFTKGFIEAITHPDYKTSLPTCVLNANQKYHYPPLPSLGEVFTACVFGHYMLARYLLPLLRRDSTHQEASRVIHCSSVEAYEWNLSVDNIQGFHTNHPYESAKRLTDILSLTYTLPSVRSVAASYLDASPAALIPARSSSSAEDDDNDNDNEGAAEKQLQQHQPPKIYLSHPGVIATALMPVPWFLFWVYELVVNIGRWLGSPWHNVNGYSGAKSASWMVLAPQAELDGLQAERSKWGSSSDSSLVVSVKKTEVEGWGWEGKVETEESLGAGDKAVGRLRKEVGRKLGAKNVTAEDLVEFEDTGRKCWQEMEKTRREWEEFLRIGDKA